MATIDVNDRIPFPVEQVYEVYRDKLPELADYLVNIDNIVCEKREEPESDDAPLKLLNRWRAAKTEVPTVARPFIKPEMLEWLDHATWHDDDQKVEWRTETSFMTEAVDARGVNYFKADGDETIVHITGTIEVDPKKIPGVPRFMAKRIKKPIEKFIVKLMEPNLRAINQGIGEYLGDAS